MSEKRRIAGAASTIGGATFISRIMGYVRDAAIAYIFGAGMSADAFFVALKVSNFLRRLVGEGALTSAFVPVFTDVVNERTKEGAKGFISAFFTLFLIILVLLTVVGILASDVIVAFLAKGFAAVPEKFSLTVSLTRLMFPYMVFISLVAMAMGVLNTLRHFAVPALSPVLFNIALIFCALVLAPVMDVPVYALAVGVLAGGALQLLVHIPFLRRNGVMPSLSFSFGDPAIKRIFLLMGPAALGIGVYQLNMLVTTRFASPLAEGSVSYLYYASRLMELPLGVFGVALTQATLPSLSEHISKNDFASFSDSLSFTMRMVSFINIPASIGLMALGLPIVSVLFMRGEFGAADAAGTAYALYFFALGIVPVALSRHLVSVFYSLKDTWTPVWGAIIALVSNVALCFILRGPLGHGGLALATSVSAAANLAFLYVVLVRRVEGIGLGAILPPAARSLAAALVMGVVVYGLRRYAGLDRAGTAAGLGLIIIIIAAGAVVYIIACRVLKVAEVSFIKGIVDEKLYKRRENKSR